MHALVRFAHLAAGNSFTTADLYPHTLAARGLSLLGARWLPAL
jgi:hypothetical protein